MSLKLEDIKVNQEYEKLVPPLPIQEYNQLKYSIKINGLYLPIIINDKGVVLDGHHRFKACHELQIKAKYRIKEFENDLLEKKFVIECNLRRRQLNDFQKTEIAIPLLEIERQLAAQRQKEGTLASNEAKGKATEKISKIMGISRPTLERAKKIIDKAPEEIKKKLRNNETTISKEYKEITKQEKQQQRETQLRKTQVKLPETVQIHNKDFRELKIPDDSVSLIFTDPPYTENSLYFYEDLAKQASRVLRDGGSLMCYTGHYALDRTITMMKKHGLRYQWQMVVIHSGSKASQHGPRVFVGYKPLLWFVKGKYEGDYIHDTIKSEFQGKELHKWAQSTVESDYYIKHMTIENDIVYDPFLGQGTFGVSAVKLNRQFIGAEINPEHFENSRRLITLANNPESGAVVNE